MDRTTLLVIGVVALCIVVLLLSLRSARRKRGEDGFVVRDISTDARDPPPRPSEFEQDEDPDDRPLLAEGSFYRDGTKDESSAFSFLYEREDWDFEDGVMTAIDSDDRALAMTFGPRDALVAIAEFAPEAIGSRKFVLELRDGARVLESWVYYDDEDPDLIGNWTCIAIADDKEVLVIAGRGLSLFAREID